MKIILGMKQKPEWSSETSDDGGTGSLTTRWSVWPSSTSNSLRNSEKLKLDYHMQTDGK